MQEDAASNAGEGTKTHDDGVARAAPVRAATVQPAQGQPAAVQSAAVQSAAVQSARRAVIFDLGGVLLDWNPRYLYRKLFDGDERAVDVFLREVCHAEWNLAQDAGRDFDDAVAALMPEHRDKLPLILAWRDRFAEMIPDALHATVAIARELKDRGVPLYALTNWSHETFPSQRRRFAFMDWFDGIVVSGEEKVIKPDPRIFRILLDRYALRADESVFIDDNPANAKAASALGLHGLHFTSAPELRRDLVSLRLL